jgi:hypothetical protein
MNSKGVGFLLLIVAVCVSCGHLTGKVITTRDLTPAELKEYQDKEEGFRLVFLWPIVIYGKVLGTEDEGLLMGRLVTALNVPVPLVGFGLTDIRAAVFDKAGKRVLYFNATGLAPLFNCMRIKAREDADSSWNTVASYNGILPVFGFGRIGKARFFSIFFITFGSVSEKDFEDMIPELGILGK